jgi:type IV fimbrial biogenesis protein FimT
MEETAHRSARAVRRLRQLSPTPLSDTDSMKKQLHPPPICRKPSAQRGFTLLEALVVIAIVGVLAAVGIPSFSHSMQRATVTAQAAAITNALRVARIEAVRRGRMVTICRTDDANATPPICATTPTGAGNLGWASGWIMFEDSNGNRGTIDADETIIAVQQAFNGSGGLIDQSGGAPVISFQPSGMPFGLIAARTFTIFSDDTRSMTNPLTKNLVIAATGRIR